MLWAVLSVQQVLLNLTSPSSASEIDEQVMHVRDDFDTRVTSVVLMGQGEPFMNS